jgi:hypothetical protein
MLHVGDEIESYQGRYRCTEREGCNARKHERDAAMQHAPRATRQRQY